MKYTPIIFLLFPLYSVQAQITSDILISNTSHHEAENSIFINPLDKTKVLNANNNITGGVDAFTSTDAGATWSTTPANFNTCDPSVIIDKNGIYYVGTACAGAFVIAKSTNSGSSWTSNAYTIVSSAADKDHIWTDNKKYTLNGSLNSDWGGLYAAYVTAGEIKFSYYDSGIPGFTTPQLISTNTASNDHNWGVNIQTGPDPTTLSQMNVYACWGIQPGTGGARKQTNIGFNFSNDGGVTWSTPSSIFTGGDISGFEGYPGPNDNLCGNPRKLMAVHSWPSMTVNPQNGYIFIVWPNYSGTITSGTGCSGTCGTCTNFPTGCNCNPDIYMIRSTTGGSSWSSPIKVNTDALIRDQWHPWIACDEASGALVCVYYDSRDFTNNDRANTYVSISYDQGNTWTDSKINDLNTDWDANSYGLGNDYIGVDVYHGRAIPVWADKRSGSPYLLTYANPFDVPCPSSTLSLTYDDYYITDEGNNFVYDAAYSATTSINVCSSTSTYKIYNGASVYMSAGNDITLNEGFECDGEFLADIGSCPSTGFSQRLNNNDSTEVSDANSSLFTPSSFPVRIFPNPAMDGKMQTYVPIIDADDEGKTEIATAIISIYNSMGAEVFQSSVSEWFTELNLSSQPAGLYLIKVTKGDKIYNGKIVLK